jgi:hypothetical protein
MFRHKTYGTFASIYRLAYELQLRGTTEGGRPKRKKGDSMFLALFVILLVMWLMGLIAFHVAGGLIHLLLIVAVISLVLHFVRGRTAI